MKELLVAGTCVCCSLCESYRRRNAFIITQMPLPHTVIDVCVCRLLCQSYRRRNAFIITQMPLPHTVIDVWRMVYEHHCTTIVMLNPWDDTDEV